MIRKTLGKFWGGYKKTVWFLRTHANCIWMWWNSTPDKDWTVHFDMWNAFLRHHVQTFVFEYWGELRGGGGIPQLTEWSGSIVSSPARSGAEPQLPTNFLSFGASRMPLPKCWYLKAAIGNIQDLAKTMQGQKVLGRNYIFAPVPWKVLGRLPLWSVQVL